MPYGENKSVNRKLKLNSFFSVGYDNRIEQPIGPWNH